MIRQILLTSEEDSKMRRHMSNYLAVCDELNDRLNDETRDIPNLYALSRMLDNYLEIMRIINNNTEYVSEVKGA